MILPALVLACCCAIVIALNLARYPVNPLSVMRSTLAAIWGAGWLAYGINLARFPPPGTETLLYLVATCAISIAMIPSPTSVPARGAPVMPMASAWRWYFRIILGLSTAVVLWDLWHVIERSTSVGLQQAIITHRLNRTLKAGSYSLPGIEVAHSMAAVTGALGYALWLSQKRAEGAFAAVVGLASMLTSTGRWDVVAYALWCLALEAVFAEKASARRFLASSVRLFVLLSIFFVAHGELLSKVGALQTAAEMSTDSRGRSLNTAEALGYHGAPGDDIALLDLSVARRACARWAEGAERANRAFLLMPRTARLFTLYFAGPFAAFDRSICEDRPAVREVILYWPQKLARLLHLGASTAYITVDPFVDIGIPYNNYTLFQPFLSTFGAAGGVLAWLTTALVLRLFIRIMFSGAAGLPGVVAGVAPFVIGVRGLWTNAFFDGSLVVYVLVALAGCAFGRTRTASATVTLHRQRTDPHLPS